MTNLLILACAFSLSNGQMNVTIKFSTPYPQPLWVEECTGTGWAKDCYVTNYTKGTNKISFKAKCRPAAQFRLRTIQ